MNLGYRCIDRIVQADTLSVVNPTHFIGFIAERGTPIREQSVGTRHQIHASRSF